MENINQALQDALVKLLNTAVSVKFWFCLAILIAGLVRGGPEGYGAALAVVAIYTGAKTYQNVQFAKLNGNGKDESVTRGSKYGGVDAARRAAAGAARGPGTLP